MATISRQEQYRGKDYASDAVDGMSLSTASRGKKNLRRAIPSLGFND